MSLFPPLKLEGYAIYNPSTGLWSRGGTGPNLWKKKPKIWSNIGHLKNHLNLSIHCEYANQWNKVERSHFNISARYSGCVVIDVTTGNPLDSNWINEYYFDYIRRQKADRKYYADYPVKFEGASEWLTNV